MNKQERERLHRQAKTLESLGFTYDESEQLRRISNTLRRWHELECGDGNGYIERDEKTGKPRYFNCHARYVDPRDPRAWSSIPDRETGAMKRLQKIINGKPLSYYIQSDPRGAALYLLRPGDVPEGAEADSYYSRGICVY